MKLRNLGLPKLTALAAAMLMIGLGFFLGRAGAPRQAEVAADLPPPTPPRQMASEPEPPAQAPEPEPQVAADPPNSQPEEQTAEPAPKPQPPPAPPRPARAAAPKPQPRPAAPRPVATDELPPFQPAYQQEEASLGPPPGVLWLSGVIQGDPEVALLRRGDNRYLVREGDLVEGRYRVLEISSNTITLRRGGRRQSLRVGQY
jgi:hypothetical protein